MEPTPWALEVVDAEALPYADGALANLVLVDVFHHWRDPHGSSTRRCERSRQAAVSSMLDPYCSSVSTRAYKRFHHERTDLTADPFADDRSIAEEPSRRIRRGRPSRSSATADELERALAEPRVVERRRLALFAYPLSGGFTGRQLVPAAVGLELSARLEALLRACAPALRVSLSGRPRALLAADPRRASPRHGTSRRRRASSGGEQAVAPAADVRLAVRPRLVADRA